MAHTETQSTPPEFKYDVAISFASLQRELAEQLATRVHDAGYAVFYDRMQQANLWGSDLPFCSAMFTAVSPTTA